MQVWVKQKAQETWQFLSPSPTPLPSPLFISLALCACQFVEGAHCIPLRCLSVCCCSLLYHASLPNLWRSLFTSQFAQNGQWRRRVLRFVTSRFSFCLAYSLWLCLPFSLRTWNANQWSTDLEDRSWGMIGYEKALTPTAKLGSWAGRQKKKTERRKINCLIRASGKKSVTPMHTPGFCQADRHDSHFLLSSHSNSEPHKEFMGMSVWKGRASCRWDESNPRATILELLTVVFKNIRSILVLRERK